MMGKRSNPQTGALAPPTSTALSKADPIPMLKTVATPVVLQATPAVQATVQFA